MGIVINVVLGQDTKTKIPVAGGGLFGFCKGFFALTESQGSRNLHAQWLVYIYGIPTTTNRLLQLANVPNSLFMDQLLAHQTTLMHAEIPISKGAICPDCNGPLQVLVVRVSAFKRPKRNVSAPIACNFLTCKTCFTSESLLQQIACKLAISKKIRPELLQPNEIETFINAPRPLPFLDATAHTFIANSVILTLTLLRFQSHSWAHIKSCFKKFVRSLSGTICRFVFPQSTNLVAVVDANFKVILKRKVGNEYINGYSPLIATTFKWNHDLCFFIGQVSD
jgi:hypothetical protein